MLGADVLPGTATRLAWQPGESFAGIAVPTPVLVVHGNNSGPVLCLTAAVHGDELNGIEMVRRVLYELDPLQLKGTVVGVPIVNLLGFKRSSRYLPDRRDLNRHFPGNRSGSSASRIAHSFFNEIVKRCTVLVDLHTGSFYRTNLPQLRADLRNPEVAAVAESFASTAVVQSAGASGSLRRAAVDAGIPTVTLEAGEPMRLQAAEVEHGVRGIFALIDQLGMYRKLRVWGNPAAVHYVSRWVRADGGGILFGKVSLGQRVREGELLGTVTDPITNVRADILSPYDGRVIGMAVDQVVLPGFAAFHIGIQPRDAPDGASGLTGDEAPDEPAAKDSLEDS
jgi:predicted deacylase